MEKKLCGVCASGILYYSACRVCMHKRRRKGAVVGSIVRGLPCCHHDCVMHASSLLPPYSSNRRTSSTWVYVGVAFPVSPWGMNLRCGIPRRTHKKQASKSAEEEAEWQHIEAGVINICCAFLCRDRGLIELPRVCWLMMTLLFLLVCYRAKEQREGARVV